MFELHITNLTNDGWWLLHKGDRLSDLMNVAKLFNAQGVTTRIVYPPNWRERLAEKLVESGDLD